MAAPLDFEHRTSPRASLFQDIDQRRLGGHGPSRSGGQVGVQCRGLAQSLGFQFP